MANAQTQERPRGGLSFHLRRGTTGDLMIMMVMTMMMVMMIIMIMMVMIMMIKAKNGKNYVEKGYR